MEKKELESKWRVNREKAAMYLEELAMSLREGEISVDHGSEQLRLDPSSDLSIAVKAKVKKDKVKFSLSLAWSTGHTAPLEKASDSHAEELAEVVAPAKKKEKYKKLKKRMSDDLVVIRSSVHHKNRLPDWEAVERFCVDSRAMCTYRKKGEPFYEEFLERLDNFSAAYDEESLPDIMVAIDSLVDMKDRCHELYK